MITDGATFYYIALTLGAALICLCHFKGSYRSNHLSGDAVRCRTIRFSSNRSVFLLLAATYICGDFLLTLIGYFVFGSQVEGNPFLAYLMQGYGVPWILLTKSLVCAAICGIILIRRFVERCDADHSTQLIIIKVLYAINLFVFLP